MKMKFKHVAAGYAVVWFLFIIGICIFEWNALDDFQFSYEEENARKEILAELRTNGMSIQPDKTTEEAADSQKLKTFEIIADTSMTITVKGSGETVLAKESLEDAIYEDYSVLSGLPCSKHVYEVKAEAITDIVVQDRNGNEIQPVDNDYVAGSYCHDEELSKIAVAKFEPYLKHISGMVSLDDLILVMQRDSKAYAAVKNSQKSLEWMIKAKSMEFTKEEVTDMQIFDENHFACDVYIELTKIPDTERERTVNEQVKYRVLYEKKDGNWYIYSFQTK